MLVYTAKKASRNAIPHTEFTQRGIAHFTQGPISDCGVVGITTEPLVTYSVYKNHIATFLAATSSKITHTIGPYPGFTYYPVDEMFQLPMPNIVFGISDKIPFSKTDGGEAMERTILDKLEKDDPVIEKYMQFKKVILRQPKWDHLRKIRNAVGMEAPVATVGELNIYYADSYYMALQVVTAFLATNTYPSHSGLDEDMDADEENDHWNSTFEIPTRFEMDAKSIIESQRVPERVAAQTWLRSVKKLTFEEEITVVKDKDIVRSAKPSTIPYTVNVGTISDVPNSPGVVFPYFHGLFVADKTSLYKLFVRRFIGVLGSTQEDIEAGIDRLRRDFDRGSGLQIHLWLTHIFFMMDLCLETQTRLFLIVQEEKYMGAVLLGGKFRIYTGMEWIGPSPSAAVQEQLSSMATHRVAVTEVCRIIDRYRREDAPGITVEELAAAKDSSWSLLFVFQRISWLKLGENEVDKDLLLKYVSQLAYGRRYKDISVDNVVWAMKQLNLMGEPLEPLHVYFPATLDVLRTVVDTNRGKILAAFGAHTFSFTSTKGQKYLLPTPPDVIPPNNAPLYSTREGPEELYIFRKPLAVAIAEFDFLRDGTRDSNIIVGSLAKERAVEQRKVCKAFGEKTVLIWNELVKFHYPRRIEQAKPKRKAGELYDGSDDEDDVEPDAKRVLLDNLVL